MKACKISIILPVYNTSEYLDECMQSLVGQSLEDIEIIAVNDGSTDNSFEILRKYQAQYPGRVYVYNTENHGVSSARNFAVEKSCGEYLWFVDSDDYIEPDACERLYAKAVDDSNDLVLFSRYDVDADTGEKTENKTFHFNQNFRMSDKPYELVKLSPFPWNKLIKKELFEKTHFPEGIRFEDLPVAFILAANAENIGVINDWFYNYRQRVGFLSKFTDSTLDIVKAVDYMKVQLEEQDKFRQFETELEYVTMRHFLYRFEQLFTVFDGESTDLKKELINTLFDYLESNYPNRLSNPYLCYNLPDRIYQLLDFYSSREAMLDYVESCRNMTADEQTAYNQKLRERYEIISENVPLSFSAIKESGKALSLEFKELQGNTLQDNAFIISHTPKGLSPSMLSITNKLSKKGAVTVFLPDESGSVKKLLDCYGINARILNTKEHDYLCALSSSRYIVSDEPLDYFFTKAPEQIYINNLCEKAVSRLVAKYESENDFSFMQKALLTADCTIYSSEQSRLNFEHKYRVEGLGVRSIDNYHPYKDKAIKTDIKSAFTNDTDKLIAIVPQQRYSDEKTAYRFFRKYMSYLLLLDRELSDDCKAFLYTGDYPYHINMDIFKHIKEMPAEYGLYDFIKASDIVITDYHPVLSACESSKVLRLFADEKRYVSDEELDISKKDFISFDNSIALADYINEYRHIEKAEASDKIGTDRLFDMLESNTLINNGEDTAVNLWYLGGKLTPARIRHFKAVARENNYKSFWLAFDEENAADYKEEVLDLFRGWNYIPLRFDNTSSFSEKMINSICTKGKPPFNSKKKLDEMKSAEWKKYFGNVKFDEITLISVGKIEQNLLFLGASPSINYSFNWFSIDKYNNKKQFKAKVDYICKELENAQSVEIPDDMKPLKAVKNLSLTEGI